MIFVKHTVTKTNCRAKVLAKFFLFSKGKRNYTTDEVIWMDLTSIFQIQTTTFRKILPHLPQKKTKKQ